MSTTKSSLITATIIASTISTSALSADTFQSALTNGESTLNIRYRYEQVEQSNNANIAHASTIRTRLGYKTGSINDFSGYLEMEDIHAIGADQYNSTNNGKTSLPTVVDPKGAELNQSYIKYKVGQSWARLGRQRIILDNARFIGNVGFRQNEQTYDALMIQHNGEITKYSYAYLGQVHTPKGTDVDMGSHLLNFAIKKLPIGKLSGYAYLLDFTNTPTSSTNTLGLSLKGKLENAIDLTYHLEYAKQRGYANNPTNIPFNYILAEFGVDVSMAKISIGYELLEGDGTTSFQTPLATGHKFNGWADLFLKTPNTGLEDIYFKATANIGKIKALAMYHEFSADTGGLKYGDEIDLVLKKKFGKIYYGELKYANFSADNNFSADVEKLWLSAGLKF